MKIFYKRLIVLYRQKKWNEIKKIIDGKYIDLSKFDFIRADFSGADFIRADFRGANFRDADFSGANFRDADFSGADFSGANFRDADFSGADFSGANFIRANFRGADFSGADFRDANFRDADFSESNYSCVSGIDAISIDGIGSNNRKTLYFVMQNKIYCGCFSGTMEEFEEKIKRTYPEEHPYRKQYDCAVQYLKDISEMKRGKQ